LKRFHRVPVTPVRNQSLEIIMAYPPEYKYTKEHEWLAVDGTTATVGITDFATNALGDIVFVELPKVGDELTAGKTFGTVESIKAVSDLFAPVSGTVTAINEELTTSPEKVNKDPHNAWMVKLTLANPAEIEALLSVADYDKFIHE
jgi:glycine cleavage system H protein